MKAIEKIRNLPGKVKRQLQTALLLACAAATFAVPAFGGGYSALKSGMVTSSAAAIEDVDLLLVAASAFGEARKAMNATDLDAKDRFTANTSSIVTASKWQNIGLIVGARDALSGSTWSAYQSPITLSATEVGTYGDGNLADAYRKYKAFGFAVQNLNNSAKKSATTSVSVEEGLDAMSTAAIKLGGFGVEFLNDYNPGPVLISLYDSTNLSRYSSNKLVQIVLRNEVLKNIVTLFGDRVTGTNLSFFLILNAVIAVVGLALSMFLTLLGNRTVGDAIRQFLIRIVIGAAGVYVVANVMSVGLNWVTESTARVGSSPESRYVEENLNVYDWYLTGFQLPSGVTLQIDSSGNFIFTPEIIRAINTYTYNRLVGGASDLAMMNRMESYVQNGNTGTASFVTPSISSDGGEAWATDVYYAVMNNYAQNKDLMDGNDDESSALYGKGGFSIYLCRYLWMSSLNMSENGDGWTVTGNGVDSYYGLNPISAFNLVRSDFSGEAITSTTTVYPELAYVSFDAVNQYTEEASTNMNALVRFIACFTLVLAAFRGLVTIFTAGFGGLFSGGVKTAFGSSNGLGQALGAVACLLFGVVGISLIMSMTMSLLDTVYGIACDLVGDVEVIDAFLQPLQEALAKVPVLGPILKKMARGAADIVMSLILALTFPKLGGIPITMFAQFMSEIPGRIAERAQMVEGMLLSGRSSAGGGLPPRGGGRSQAGQVGRQMAQQAFSSSSRQAGQIVKAGAMASGALIGASLSTAGRALNRKADGVEGRPDNPGISNWDEMTPEQQAKAAAAAEATENWDKMDQDSRQRALQEAGVYDNNAAQAGSVPDTNQRIEDLPDTEGAENSSGVAASAGEPGEGDVVEDSTWIPEVGTESSMNNVEMSGASPAESAEGAVITAEQSLAGTEVSTAAPVEVAASGGTVSHTGSGSTGSGPENAAAPAGNTLNVREGDTVEGTSQQLDTSVEQRNRTDAMNVDQSRNLNGDNVSEVANNSLDGRGAGSTNNVPGANLGTADTKNAGGMQGVPGTGTARSLSSAGGSGKVAGTAQHGMAGPAYQSVNNQMQGGDNRNVQGGDTSALNANAQVQQNAQFNTGGDRSQTLSVETQEQAPNGQAGQAAQGLDGGVNKEAQKAAGGGVASQSMNGMATSKWGKEMDIRQQKQARALHAAGDALQMMGGNRTMGDGVRDAMGYTAEALGAAVTPPEMMNSFAQDIRNRRQLRMELARRDRQQKNEKKK